MQFFLVLVCYKEAGENTVTSKAYCIFAASFWYIWSKDSGYKGTPGYGASSAPPEVLSLQIYNAVKCECKLILLFSCSILFGEKLLLSEVYYEKRNNRTYSKVHR